MLLTAGLINHQRNASGTDQATSQEFQVSPESAPASPDVAAHPPPANPNPDRKEWRAERDLESQQGMARWAQYLFFATVIGLALLTATLLETRKAAQAADAVVHETKRIGEAQVRAYVTVRDVAMSMNAGRRYPTVSFEVANSGKSPALELTPSVSAKITIMREGEAVRTIGDFDEAREVILGTLRPEGADNRSVDVTYIQASNEDVVYLRANESLIDVRIRVQFKDVFDQVISEKFDFQGPFTFPTQHRKFKVPPRFDFVAATGEENRN